MKIVHSWLAELVDVGDDVESNAALLSELGLAVDDVQRVGSTVAGVITAKVVRTERHPDAAKVHRVFVDAGDGVERHVWCGAFNMVAGDIVPLATAGTVMPDGRVIEPKPILGIPSQGMLCSARELGIGDDHGGILLLPTDSALGVAYGDVLGLVEETVYVLDVTRNRPDALGHLGVARDLAARLDVPVRWAPSSPALGTGRSATVDLVDEGRCGRFTTVVLSGVTVGSSPDWMVRRLVAAGMRPINNVVDVSNYVMLETNQPNHAYDLDTLGGGGFRIRSAVDGEALVTLDGVERPLVADDLLICDGDDRPIGLAGIMGGLDTEISTATTTIALEVAWFEPLGIMRTAQRLGLRSEASARFERGVDPMGIDAAVARFVELLSLSCPALVVHDGRVDARSDRLPGPVDITVRPARVGALLGPSFTAGQIVELIEPIGFRCRPEGEHLVVTAPTWRPDCTDEVDIVEEIARMYGYERIGRTVPRSPLPGGLSAVQQRRRRLREVLLGIGISEAMPHPFLGEGDLARVGLDSRAVRLVNPLVVGDDVLRTSLRPGLLGAVGFNESHRSAGVRLFEIGHVYPPGDGELPDEHEALGVVLAGAQAPEAVAVWREIASAMGWGARLDQSVIPAGMHPGRSATLSVGRDVVGHVGEVHPDVLEAVGITERVAVLELHLGRLLGVEPRVPQWRPTSRFPSADMDLAFAVPDTVAAERVDKALRQAVGGVLVDLGLFDVYRGRGVPDGARSLAYRLRVQAPDRTLTDADLGQIRDRAVAAVEKLGATLRA